MSNDGSIRALPSSTASTPKPYLSTFEPMSYASTSHRETVGLFNSLKFYLCGYSLKTCAIYMVIIDITVIVLVLLITMGVYNYFDLSIVDQYEEHTRTYSYSFVVNNRELFSVVSKHDPHDVLNIIQKMLIALSSFLITDFIINLVALIGILLNKVLYVIPFIGILLNTVLWTCLVLVTDALLSGVYKVTSFMFWPWVILFVAFVQKLYKLLILCSYLYHYSIRKMRREHLLLKELGATTKPIIFPPNPLKIGMAETTIENFIRFK